ncbi:MAG: hypothetical protein COB02_08245 [Candidatus Cloacimonadota bacterium]|nr:MAG: hypothetical protein COB02_08245 [Candidatus Cloacimonadota bacterium]
MIIKMVKCQLLSKFLFLQTLILLAYFLLPLFHTHHIEFESDCETTHHLEQSHWHADFLKKTDTDHEECVDCNVLTQNKLFNLAKITSISFICFIVIFNKLNTFQKSNFTKNVRSRGPPLNLFT